MPNSAEMSFLDFRLKKKKKRRCRHLYFRHKYLARGRMQNYQLKEIIMQRKMVVDDVATERRPKGNELATQQQAGTLKHDSRNLTHLMKLFESI
jgi:hypothetical protein